MIPSEHVEIMGRKLVISYTICYDATFSDFLLTMDRKTNLYINPSWDWSEIVDLNYRMQGISAIQNGVVLFKPTVDGWSTVMDPYGKLYYKFSTLGQDYDKVFFADVPFGRARTLYRHLYKFIRPFWTILILLGLLELGRVIALNFMRKRGKRVKNDV